MVFKDSFERKQGLPNKKRVLRHGARGSLTNSYMLLCSIRSFLIDRTDWTPSKQGLPKPIWCEHFCFCNSSFFRNPTEHPFCFPKSLENAKIIVNSSFEGDSGISFKESSTDLFLFKWTFFSSPSGTFHVSGTECPDHLESLPIIFLLGFFCVWF